MNTKPRKRTSHHPGKPDARRGTVVRTHPVFSNWLVPHVLHGDRTTFVTSPGGFALSFCRSFVDAAIDGRAFGSVAIPRGLRCVIATVRSDIPADLAAKAAVCKLAFHWDALTEDGDLARVVKATSPELIVVEGDAAALAVARTRFGDSSAPILCPTERPAGDTDSIQLRVVRADEGFAVENDTGSTVVRLDDHFAAQGIPSFDYMARLRAGKLKDNGDEHEE